jgi:hypothetical protein
MWDAQYSFSSLRALLPQLDSWSGQLVEMTMSAMWICIGFTGQ